MPPANQQLGAGYLERLGKVSSTPIELLHSEIDQEDVAPGKTSTGVLAIHSTEGSPAALSVRFRLRQRVSDRRGGGAVMATGAADTLDSETVRSELLAMYHARAGQGFLQSLLDAAQRPDPARGPGKAAAVPPAAGHAVCRRGDRGRGICLLHPHVTVKLGRTESFRIQGDFMPVTAARRYHDPNDEAKLLLGFIAVAAIAGVGYICYARLHIRKEQLMEASLYLLAAAFVFWDMLRYVLTAPSRTGERLAASATDRRSQAGQPEPA